MHFPYFNGPENDMAMYAGRAQCDLCGTEAPAFSLEYAICPALPEHLREGKAGCIDCLERGRFEFRHDTEIGILDEHGLHRAHSDAPAPLNEEALIGLRRTPQIATWQQELWLTHCADFMVYEGTWAPSDFYANAPDGDGRALFLRMTTEGAHLWDESIPAGQEKLEEWHATYYVFRCRHCGTLRGNWDCR